MLKGPYQSDELDCEIEAGHPGVFVISADGQTVALVGRSDKDLRGHLKRLFKRNRHYRYFWFEYASSPQNAFYKECRYYHKYPPKGKNAHPVPPRGLKLRCPVRTCRAE
ncbi:MAG: hypothetical protein ABIK49_01665 [candidate division WOR-3 bacterium]